MRTKTQANRLGMYDDVRQVLDAAMHSGGGQFKLDTHGQAVHWRQRAYKFRKLYAEIMASDKSLAMSPYDRLTLPQIEDDSSTVVIKVREITGVFTPNRESSAPAEMPVVGDDLFEAARSIAKKIQDGGL